MRANSRTDRPRRRGRQAALGFLLPLAWLAAPAAAHAGLKALLQDNSQTAQAAAVDPVVQEVVRMLKAKVTEPVILRWLDTSGRRPGAVGSREVIELKQAGASDQIIEKLLDTAAKGGGATTRGRSAGPAPGDPARGSATPPHAANLHWTIHYHPNFLEDDVRWDLFLYLDGHYLAWVKAPLVSFLDKPLEFDASLAPGHHVLRLVEERHVRKPNTNEWDNQARVAPKPLELDLKPDLPGKVDLQVEVRTRGGPISLRVIQGDAEVLKAQPSVPLPEHWPPLCEEVPGQRDPCLHWADLWPGVPAPPSREEVRADLERHNFRPEPAHAAE